MLKILALVTLGRVSHAIKGYSIGDNKLNISVGPDDGYLSLEMSGYIPSTLTGCIRFNPDYNRHGDQYGLWNIYTPYEDLWPAFDMYCRSFALCTSLPSVLIQNKKGAYPKENWLRKWNSICVGIDYIDDEIIVYFNGKKYDREKIEKERKENGKFLSNNLPKGYFSGKIFKLNKDEILICFIHRP